MAPTDDYSSGSDAEPGPDGFEEPPDGPQDKVPPEASWGTSPAKDCFDIESKLSQLLAIAIAEGMQAWQA